MKVLDLLSCFVSGFRLTNRNILQFFRLNLLILSFVFLFSYIAAIAAIKLTYNRQLQEIIVLAISFPFFSYIFAGSSYYYLSYYKGITVRLTKFFRGYRWIGNYVKYSFFILLIYQIVVVPVFNINYYEIETQIRILFGGLFFFWALARGFFLPLIFIESKKSFEWCLFESMRLSKGHFASITLFYILSLLVALLGFLCAGAGILYSIAVVVLAYIKFYDKVRSNESTEY